ncbi:hypothetical protein HK098_000711 [Nowakowskiella sp. JEL0407]|nr:hypothetical protein HK098_000711 [Nowakowskiella sp. JEL0407]
MQARSSFLIRKYGLPLAFHYALKSHRSILSPDISRVMLANGVSLPRFFVQSVIREYHLKKFTGSVFGGLGNGEVGGEGNLESNSQGSSGNNESNGVSTSLYVFFVLEGYRLYGTNADFKVSFKDDDSLRFERLLYSAFSGNFSSRESLKLLIYKYKFVPFKGYGSSLDESLFTLSRLDMALLDGLFRNGFQLTSELNNLVMERVICRIDVTEMILKTYLEHGFEISPTAVKKGLLMGKQSVLNALRAHVNGSVLQSLTEESIADIVGPTTRGWTFSPSTIDFLRASFTITDDMMEKAIFVRPPSITPLPPGEKVHDFPATRAYFKNNPSPFWLWVLRTYGPHHPFTIACFDDALSRASGDQALHDLHDAYLSAGVKFRPRHVKILACRVLHRDMATNSLGLIKRMKNQLIASFLKNSVMLEKIAEERFRVESLQESLGGSVSVDSVSETGSVVAANELVPLTMLPLLKYYQYPGDINETGNVKEWIKLLRQEIIGNNEWIDRMHKTQLEGGPRGGMYKLTHPPEDGLKFLAEAGIIVDELDRGINYAVVHYRRAHKRKSFAKRVPSA